MNRYRLLPVAALLVGVLILPTAASAMGFSFGGGLHYLRTLGDIKDSDGIDENAFGIIATAVYEYPLVRIEADIEYIPDFLGLDEPLWVPQGFVLAGGTIYGGAGIGSSYYDGEWASDPFYALRAGVDLALANFDLDIFTMYQFRKDDNLEGLGTDDADQLTFGAIARFGL